MNGIWHNASKRHPCPVCGHTDWCTILEDESVVVCRRVPSPKPAKSGIGWVHFLKDRPVPPPVCPSGFENRVWSQPTTNNQQPTTHEVRAAYAAMTEDPVFLDEMAIRLGVAYEALYFLGLRRDTRGNAAFPMKDAEGAVTGVRLREPGTSRKWSVRGSKDGLFYSRGFENEKHEEIVVLEGTSDAAAAISAGLDAVGRSSCLTGGTLLKALCRRCRTRRLTVVADLDSPKTRPDGTTWRPGLDGAKRLVEDVGLPARIVLPPPGVKDFRDWRARDGMCAAKFNRFIGYAKWIMPKTGGAK